VGSAPSRTTIPSPDGSILEPAGSSLERAAPATIGSGCAVVGRLGSPASSGGSATTDRRAFVECAGACRLGRRAQDRRACGSGRALVVGAGRDTGRAVTGSAALESARTRGARLVVVGSCPCCGVA
jgi:hypothetical protein